MALIASDAGFKANRNEPGLVSYSKGALGMHFATGSGEIQFVNGHCPVLPFWIRPGKAFEKRWEDAELMLKKLDENGFSYCSRAGHFTSASE
jgi:hypothetical protein